MKKALTFIVLCTLLLGAAPAAFAKSKIANIPLKKYTDPDGRFSIKLPKKWNVSSKTESGLIFGASEKPLGESRNSNITVASLETASEFTDDIEDTKQQFGEIFTNHRLLDDRKYTVNGAQAHLLGSRFNLEDVVIRNQQLFIKKDSTLYIITATAYLDDWKSYKKLFSKIFKSFKVQ